MKRLTKRVGDLKDACIDTERFKTIGEFVNYIAELEESGKIQIMDCTGCVHKSNKSFCLNCFRGGFRDYYLEEKEEGDDE